MIDYRAGAALAWQAIFVLTCSGAVLCLAYASSSKMSDAAVKKVKKFFKIAGYFWWYGTMALCLLLAVHAKTHTELYYFKTVPNNTMQTFNSAGFGTVTNLSALFSNGSSITLGKEIVRPENPIIKKIDNSATIKNVYDWIMGAVGWWLMTMIVLLAARAKWLGMRLAVYEPRPEKKKGLFDFLRKKIEEADKNEPA